MSVLVENEPSLRLDIPENFFSGAYVGSTWNQIAFLLWDISSAEKRFLMIKPSTGTDEVSTPGNSNKINAGLNWFEELKEQVSD